MQYTKKIYISLLIVSTINAMLTTICTGPSFGMNPMGTINPCIGTGPSFLPDFSTGGISSMPGMIGSGSDMININCHVSGGSGSLTGAPGIGSTNICIPTSGQPGIDLGLGGGLAGLSGNVMQPFQPNGIQIACNTIGMPDKTISLGGNSGWGNDCYTKIGSIFMNGMPGGGSKLNDICCTLTGPGMTNKLLR